MAVGEVESALRSLERLGDHIEGMGDEPQQIGVLAPGHHPLLEGGEPGTDELLGSHHLGGTGARRDGDRRHLVDPPGLGHPVGGEPGDACGEGKDPDVENVLQVLFRSTGVDDDPPGHAGAHQETEGEDAYPAPRSTGTIRRPSDVAGPDERHDGDDHAEQGHRPHLPRRGWWRRPRRRGRRQLPAAT